MFSSSPKSWSELGKVIAFRLAVFVVVRAGIALIERTVAPRVAR